MGVVDGHPATNGGRGGEADADVRQRLTREHANTIAFPEGFVGSELKFCVCVVRGACEHTRVGF